MENEDVFNRLAAITKPDIVDQLFAQNINIKCGTDILLEGYHELLELLKVSGNIDKQTLQQSIGKTLKLFANS